MEIIEHNENTVRLVIFTKNKSFLFQIKVVSIGFDKELEEIVHRL